MGDILLEFLLYFLKLFGLTLGIIVVCGFAVRLFSRAFAYLIGHGSHVAFDVTAMIGTPVHELGHAIMCLIFGHKINRIKLWSPTHENGVYGFVEHSFNRKNLWARLGCLFIGVGPIFSGLGVIILVLWLCFPTQWDAYLVTTSELFASGADVWQHVDGIFSLLGGMISNFGEDWVRSLIGVLIILPVSLHITLSWQDVKSAMGAMPFYLALLFVFALVTMLFGVHTAICDGLWLLNLRAMSIFCVVIVFSAVWVVLALLVRLIRKIFSLF